MIRTAIFGGSFNPIHSGHVHLAQQVLAAGLADEVWLMVSPHNPLKAQDGLLDEQARLRLARLAVDGVDGVFVSDFEFSLPRPSYTWRTLQALGETYPERQFLLLIGADNWAVFDQWAHHEDLVRHYGIIVYPREGYPLDSGQMPVGIHVLDTDLYPCSSTLVRERLAQGEDCSAYVPAQVLDEIERCGYYRK